MVFLSFMRCTCVSDLLIFYLQRRQAGLKLCEAEAELRLDLRLGGDLGHLI